MDQYLKTLENDIRLLRRNNRNGLILTKEIIQRREDLPDSIDMATWLNPNGTECDEETIQMMQQYHKEGFESLFIPLSPEEEKALDEAAKNIEESDDSDKPSES